MNLLIKACLPLIVTLATMALFASVLRRRYPQIVLGCSEGIGIAFVGWASAVYLLALALSAVDGLSGMNWRIAGSLLFILSLGCAWFAKKTPRLKPPSKQPSLSRTGIGVVACVAIGLATCWVLACPPLVWDALSYHLPMAAAYLQQQNLDAFATQNPRMLSSPHGGELQALAFIAAAGNDVGIEFPGVLALLVILVVIHGALAPRAEAPLHVWIAGGLASLSFLTAPQILATAVSGKSDLSGCALILLAAWAAKVASRPAPTPARQQFYAALAGWTSALALGTKVLGGNALLGLAAMILLFWLRSAWDFRRALWFGGAIVAGLLIFVVPHSIRSFAAYGTVLGLAPIHVGDLSVARESLWLTLWQNTARAGEVLIRPLTWFGREPNSEHAHLGWALLIGVPAALCLMAWTLVRTVRRGRCWYKAHGLEWCSYILVFCCTLFVVRRHEFFVVARFLMPLVAVFAILIFGAPAFRVRLARASSKTRFVWVGFISCLALWSAKDTYFTPFLGYCVREAIARDVPLTTGASALGRENAGAGYSVLEGQARTGDRVLYIGSHNSLMYPCFGQRLEREVWGVASAEDLERKLAKKPDWVIVERDAKVELIRLSLQQAGALGYVQAFRGENRAIFRLP